jgi:N-acetylneuraminic acid mutarotase
LNTGGIYDPATDTWTPTSVAGAPGARSLHEAVWTGSKMIVWGGTNDSLDAYFNTGGVYDPATDTWTATSMVGAPAPRWGHTAVWTGSRMIVWGGEGAVALLNTGGIYDPATNNWAPTPTSGAPGERFNHTAVWTGTKMIVWGGLEWALPALGTGGIYDPATNTWAATTQSLAPISRSSHTAVWTGSRMVVWGGHCDGFTPCVDVGYLYDPGTDTWRRTSTSNEPAARTTQSAVWAGTQMIVWGGFVPTTTWNPVDTGGVYGNPAPDASGTGFSTVTPCRAVDTRNAAGPAGGPILSGGWTRGFPVTGAPCGIPSTAVAVSVNLTAVGAGAAGHLTLFPGDWVSPPPVSNLNFRAGLTRAGNAVVPLATDGTGTIQVKNGSAASVHFVLDVNGYFE